MPRLYLLAILILTFSSAAFAQEGYYHLGNETVELRPLPQANAPKGPQAMISSKDIEGIAIQQNPYTHELEARILFKASSWPTVHDLSSTWKGKDIAILKSGKVFAAPKLMDPLVAEARVSLTPEDIKKFAQGFVPATPLSAEVLNDQWTSYLKQNLQKDPKDYPSIEHLAYLYYRKQDFTQAIPLFEQLIQANVAKTNVVIDLGISYLQQKNYSKAEELFKRPMKKSAAEEWAISSSLAEVYKLEGKNDLAIAEFQRSVTLIKAFKNSAQYQADLETMKKLGNPQMATRSDAELDNAIKRIEGEIQSLKK